MHLTSDEWKSRKRLFWGKIWSDLEIGYLDRDLLPLLLTINRDSDLYTTSSCSGRIVVMDSLYPWSREETGVVFKSHTPVKVEELDFLYSLKPYKNVWINVTGPILHVYALSSKKAVALLKTARRLGFKHSGVLSASKRRGYFLELITGIYISQLILGRSGVIVNRESLFPLVDILNQSLLEGKLRLESLYAELSNALPEGVDRFIEEDIAQRGFLSYRRTPIDIFRETCREKGLSC
ncbi:MAG: hypothetical protein QXW94_03730 [Desulfurococcaceae archaeon]